jgi:hypothetical protein
MGPSVATTSFIGSCSTHLVIETRQEQNSEENPEGNQPCGAPTITRPQMCPGSL